MKTKPIIFTLILIFFSILLVGCQREIDLYVPEKEVSSFKTNSALSTPPAQVHVIAKPNPHEYDHLIEWSFDEALSVYLYVFLENEKKLIHFSNEKTSSFTYTPPSHLSTLSYSLEKHLDSQMIETFPLAARVPKDFVFSDTTTLEKNMSLTLKENYNRVFLKDNSRIQTLNHDLVIEVNEIIVEKKATIETFALSQKASMNKKGRSGGNIRLVSQKASGSLNVYLRGEDGGDGSSPRPKSGRPPQASSGIYKIVNSKCHLSRKTENGHQGQRGNKGNPGQGGGNTGSLFVEIYENNNFHLSYDFMRGRGGLGGEGGLGQKGGLPGKLFNQLMQEPSTTDSRGIICAETQKVRTGPRGEMGDQGINGETGSKGLICLRLSKDEKLLCYDGAKIKFSKTDLQKQKALL